jgi:hypothetical protein
VGVELEPEDISVVDRDYFSSKRPSLMSQTRTVSDLETAVAIAIRSPSGPILVVECQYCFKFARCDVPDGGTAGRVRIGREIDSVDVILI